ncbi:ALBINO3 chloroplastic isoform B [Chlorella sorokiniana]|uniref:ALBINO3 chloroplastic isoform B n=1 Tax=Chlorella sorokiniana TaxID=3076 RepID=A0A2P6TJD5_CHLSO|nr:ALBINO3 chloroplastic isoform B [Chlorella sorokiniana]|eukprot:PRW39360.1 ALBINO3 chloroplastic isoform B [Chlorella sorokiniana]
MTLAAAPVAGRQQRLMSSRSAAPAGLAPLRGLRPRPVRCPAVAVRAQLEDALAAAADSAPSALDSLAAHLTTQLFFLGDAAEQLANSVGGSDAAQAVADAVNAVGDAPVQAAAEAAPKNSGFFGAFAGAFEAFLKVLDDGLEKLHVPYSYGFAIILLTVLVKLATYPLTAKQVESTLSMQSLQPRVKELQAKYAGDQERLQVETAKLYQNAGVNPLAGCLPSLATIPIFIGLYRALSNVADEGLLTDGFFWIPSLAGPTTVNGGLGWLTSWENGAPQLGWSATGAYLVLPILLIVSQYISQKVISPPQSNDPSQQQTQAILKFLPLMIGYFSLNVPSGLTLYWFANNLITTAQQLYLRNKFGVLQGAAAGGAGGSASTAVIDVQPEEKKPSGKELNARRSSKQVEAAAAPAPSTSAPAQPSGGSGRGEKFRAIKAREAAARAAKQAGSSGNGAAPAAAQAQAEPAAAAVAVVEPEVVEPAAAEAQPAEEQQAQQHQAAPPAASGSSSPAAGGKGGKKKGGKRKY